MKLREKHADYVFSWPFAHRNSKKAVSVYFAARIAAAKGLVDLLDIIL